jgi:hypothetical protein
MNKKFKALVPGGIKPKPAEGCLYEKLLKKWSYGATVTHKTTMLSLVCIHEPQANLQEYVGLKCGTLTSLHTHVFLLFLCMFDVILSDVYSHTV